MSDSDGTSPSEKCETKGGEKNTPCFICFAPWAYFYRRWIWWPSASLSYKDLVFRMAILKNKSQPGFPQLDWQFSFRLNLEAVTSLPQKRELEVLGYTGSQHRGAWYDLFVCLLDNGKLLLKKLHLKQLWFSLCQSSICQKSGISVLVLSGMRHSLRSGCYRIWSTLFPAGGLNVAFMCKFICQFNDAMCLFNDPVSPYRAASEIKCQAFRLHSLSCHTDTIRVNTSPFDSRGNVFSPHIFTGGAAI